MTEEVKNEEKSLNLVDFILIIFRWKRFILICTAIIGVIAVILYFFVFNLIYVSSATIKSSGKSPSLLMGLEGIADMGGLSDIVGGSSSAKELSYYTEVLMSRRCIEPLIVKYDLMKRDDIEFMEDAVKNVQKEKLFISLDKASGLLTLSVYDKDKVLAKEMTDFLISELDKINIELSTAQARNNREYIEKRYFQAKEDLTRSEDSLKTFQLIYGIAPDLQIKAAAQSMFTLEAELKAEEVKLDVLKKILSPDQPEVKMQESKVNSLQDKISGIRTSTDINDVLSLGNSPQIAMSFMRLQRELEIQTKILTFLLPVYEQAKIEEKKETPTIMVLDKPFVADRKTKPKRLTMVLVSMIGAFFVLSIGTIIYETSFKKIINSFKGR